VAIQLVPLKTNGLVLMTLSVYHNVSFIKHKNVDFLKIYHPATRAPVQQCARSANHYVIPQLLPFHH